MEPIAKYQTIPKEKKRKGAKHRYDIFMIVQIAFPYFYSYNLWWSCFTINVSQSQNTIHQEEMTKKYLWVEMGVGSSELRQVIYKLLSLYQICVF